MSKFRDPPFKIENLEIGYNGILVAGPLTFEVKSGQCIFVAGENGCGKSTLLKTLAGVLKPISVKFFGSEALSFGSLLPAQSEISDALNGFDVLDLLEFNLSPWLSAKAAFRDIEHLCSRPIRSLSSGERQRILIAGLLGKRSPLLLFDEPWSYLDWKTSHQLRHWIQLDLDQGRTFLITSHELSWALKFPNSLMWLLHRGAILKSGASTEVLISPEIQEAFNVKTALTDNPLEASQLLATTGL